MMLRVAVPMVLLCSRAWGHGHMNHPPSRQLGSPKEAGTCQGGQCLWFSQPVHIPGSPTLNDAKYRTYNVDVSSGDDDWTRKNPWRAPGSAPVYGSGCGTAAGGPKAEPNGGVPFPGIKQGADSLTMPALDKAKWTVWTRGAVEEAMFAITANHGGGYSYRLCKKGGDITEECFQRTPLHFVGNDSWVQWGDDASNRTAIPRVTVSEGTTPAGSQWARNPIPPCFVAESCTPAGRQLESNSCGGYRIPALHSCPDGATQFPPPAPGIMGFGGCNATVKPPLFGQCSSLKAPKDNVIPIGFDYNIVDRLQVPANIEPGEYMLSWRWDCEQSPQIWQTCSEIVIADPAVQV